MLQPSAGARIHAAQPARNAAVHQLRSRLQLFFEARDNVTRLRVGVQDPPWRVIRGFTIPGGGSLVHLHNVSGGVLAGDRLYLSAAVGPEAVAQITSTGATRLYRHRPGERDSESHMDFSVGPGGLLEYLPDPVIPFRDARHRQSITVTLAQNATYFGWDILAPGRQAMGEQWAFERLQAETRIQSADRPIMLEKFLLQPRLRPPQSIGRLGHYSHVVTFCAVQPRRPAADLRQLEATLTELACEVSGPDTIWGASTLASDGVIVRGLSISARHLPATLTRFWTAAKRFLCSLDAVPPRKIR